MDIKARISKSVPLATFHQDGPAHPGGAFVVDARWNERHVTVEYSPRHGYGISASDEVGLGVGPDEVFRDVEAAASRVIELLQTGDQTSAPRLRAVREARGITQAQVARILGVGQAAVSKLESRSEITVGSLRRFIQALGGHLSVTADFPDGSFPILDDLSEVKDGAAQQDAAPDVAPNLAPLGRAPRG